MNGEINNKELIKELYLEDLSKEERQIGAVITALFNRKGTSIFKKLKGKFILLFWDRQKECLYTVRDSFGIKTVYYKKNSSQFLLSSDQKMIYQTFSEKELSKEALQLYLSFQYIPEPLTIHKKINRLKAGHFIVISNSTFKINRFFHAQLTPIRKEHHHFIEQIQQALVYSVQTQMKPHEKVGTFLSGGIDSTILTAIAQQKDPHIKAFTISFLEEGYSEGKTAKKTAQSLDINHDEYILTAEEFISDLPKIIKHLEAPLADPSCIPLYYVSREAKNEVNTVLSDEGADELFGGYNKYRETIPLRGFKYLPKSFHRIIKRLAQKLPEGIKGKSFLLRGTTPLEERYIGNRKLFEEDEKARFLHSFSEKSSYQRWIASYYQQVHHLKEAEKMQYIDLQTWLSGNILFKVDRLTRVHQLNARLPFLTQNVFHIAQKLMLQEKLSKGTTKTILREAFQDFIPSHTIHQRKLGYPVPLKQWLRSELYLWAKKIFQKSNIDHLIDQNYCLSLLSKHKRQTADYSKEIWALLIFILWYKIFIEHEELT